MWDSLSNESECMKRLRGRLFTILSAVSLLLCVATAIMWALNLAEASYMTSDGHFFEFKSRLEGGFELKYGVRAELDKLPLLPVRKSWGGFMVETWQMGAIEYTDHGQKTIFYLKTQALRFPRWCMGMIAALAGILPGMWAYRRSCEREQDRRRARGECAVCGYDMRSSPQRCPECGTAPPAKAAT
jgi:hypothetical protein